MRLLGAFQVELQGRNLESACNQIPSLCVHCIVHTMDDGFGNTMCDACAGHTRRIGQAKSNIASHTLPMVTNGLIAVAAVHMAVQTAQTTRAPASTSEELCC